MCSGMATMANIERVVYGQKDIDFSGALDRLSLNSLKYGGFKPYARNVISDPAPTEYREDLDLALKHFLEIEDEKYIAKFLSLEIAKEIYKNATNEFLNYKVNFTENQVKYEQAKKFLEKLKKIVLSKQLCENLFRTGLILDNLLPLSCYTKSKPFQNCRL